MQAFVKIADEGGFAAAARSLGISPPAVTRLVAMLEDHVGTRLLVRTTRTVRPTESGARFLEDCRRILLELEEAEESAAGSHAAPRGTLHVTAPAMFGMMYVGPALGEFLDTYPLLNARTMFADRIVNLADEGLDVAVRIGELPDSSLIAVRVGEVRRVVFASPGYIARYGRPESPGDLGQHRIVHSLAVRPSPEWEFQIDGKTNLVRVHARLQMNTNDAVIDLVRRDWGISRLLSYQIGPDLAAGLLEPLLQAYEMPAMPIHVVHQEGRLASAKVRAFVDWMVDRLRAHPHLQ